MTKIFKKVKKNLLVEVDYESFSENSLKSYKVTSLEKRTMTIILGADNKIKWYPKLVINTDINAKDFLELVEKYELTEANPKLLKMILDGKQTRKLKHVVGHIVIRVTNRLCEQECETEERKY